MFKLNAFLMKINCDLIFCGKVRTLMTLVHIKSNKIIIKIEKKQKKTRQFPIRNIKNKTNKYLKKEISPLK